ncbi:MAG: hypothetical protein GTN78_22410 [Gemmatimonadales bacterium]|nr:hypothetical protein [Gemmatimonadales bacterium]NIR02920.1 hypothetical protein [Gemmatimonadales bacterium]
MQTTAGRALALLSLSAVTGSAAVAQEAPTLKAGARVRVWSAVLEQDFQIGNLLLLGPRSLTILADSANPRMTFALSDIERLDVSRGHHPALVYGAPLLGAALGALLAPALSEEERDCALDIVDDPKCRKEVPDEFVGAAIGALLFRIVFSRVARERWAEVPLEQFHLGAVVGQGGTLALWSSIRF